MVPYKDPEKQAAYQRNYHREYHRKRYDRIIAKMHAALGGRCVVCGTTNELEIDHIDPSTKEFAVTLKWQRPWSVIEPELKKCQLLCHDHHIAKTRSNGESGGGHNRIVNPDHGTWARYTNFKCRCDSCREWRNLYRKKMVDAQGRPRPSRVP